MAIIAEVRFAHEDSGLFHTLNELPEVDVSVVRDARTDPGHDVYVIQFSGGELTEIEAVLEDDHTVESVTRLPGFETQQLLGIEFAPVTLLLNPKVTAANGFVIEARGSAVDGTRGWHERWLLPDGEALRSIWRHAREQGFDFEVVELHQHGRADKGFHGSDVVTEEQREALTAAREGGYFTEPREMSLEELAETLGISSTAAAGRLRRGMKALVGATLILDEDE